MSSCRATNAKDVHYVICAFEVEAEADSFARYSNDIAMPAVTCCFYVRESSLFVASHRCGVGSGE